MVKKPTGKKRTAGKKPAAKPRRRWKIAGTLIYWGLVASMWLLIGAGAVIAYYTVDLPDSSRLLDAREGTSVRIHDRTGALISTRGSLYGGPVSVSDMPPHLLNAVIAIEDRNFRNHPGFDPWGIARAIYTNIRAKRVSQGGSTITQQLAKNLFLTSERTFRRKSQELILAIWLDLKFTKDEILTIYLNRVYLGAGTHGVEAASQRYFGKPVGRMSVPEAAMVAGLLKAPSRYAPTVHMDRARERAALVIRAMEEEGYLSSGEARAALDAPAKLARTRRGTGTGYVTDYVMDIVPFYAGNSPADILVYTTLDAEAQRLADRTVKSVLDRDGGRLQAGQAALVSLTPQGAIRAMIGGRDYGASQFNRASQALRQPGSAFKPFVYLAALRSGYRPNSIVDDRLVKYSSFAPKNYGKKYYGPVTLRTALAKSLNSVAVQLTKDVGPAKVRDLAMAMGISGPLAPDLALALGASETTLIDMARAYAPFANGGFAVVPHVIERIETVDGKLLYERLGSSPGPVISRDESGIMSDMMRGVIEDGTGKAARLPGRAAAGKTGTSSDFRDALFVGYTAESVTAVWVGNDDSSPMVKVTGGKLPAEIWRTFTAAYLEGEPSRPLIWGEPPEPPRVSPRTAESTRLSRQESEGFSTLRKRLSAIFGNSDNRRKRTQQERDNDWMNRSSDR